MNLRNISPAWGKLAKQIDEYKRTLWKNGTHETAAPDELDPAAFYRELQTEPDCESEEYLEQQLSLKNLKYQIDFEAILSCQYVENYLKKVRKEKNPLLNYAETKELISIISNETNLSTDRVEFILEDIGVLIDDEAKSKYIEELKAKSAKELKEMGYKDPRFKYVLPHFKILRDNSIEEAEKITGFTRNTINEYRSIFIKYGFLDVYKL